MEAWRGSPMRPMEMFVTLDTLEAGQVRPQASDPPRTAAASATRRSDMREIYQMATTRVVGKNRWSRMRSSTSLV